MGLEIEYKGADGRKYNSLEAMLKAESGKLVDEAAKNLERAVRAQRCSVHGQNATISIRKSGDGFSYAISGCCDDLESRAERVASSFSS